MRPKEVHRERNGNLKNLTLIQDEGKSGIKRRTKTPTTEEVQERYVRTLLRGKRGKHAGGPVRSFFMKREGGNAIDKRPAMCRRAENSS